MTDVQQIDDDLRLAALMRWRSELIESGAVSQSSFKEAHVRLVLRSGATEVDEIRAILPGAVAAHAEGMARVLQGWRVADDESVLDATDAAQPRFARYAYGASEREVHELSLRRIPRGAALAVSWPALVGLGEDADHVVYRLVSTEGSRGYSPDSAHLVQVTTGTTATDDRPVTSAVRHFQVWANVGASKDDALGAQPVLHAAGVVIGTPTDVEIGEDFGRVIGRWSALPGVDAIRVYRVPVELAEHDGPAFRIAADRTNLTGFLDDDAERGCKYLYRVRCEVEVDGVVRLSGAVESAVQMSAVHEPVTDLAVRLPDNPAGTDGNVIDLNVIDLEWTPPRFGDVLVFRTPDPPSADAQGGDLDASVLDQVGLSRDALLCYPVSERVDDLGVRRSTLAGVPWPHGWNRAYFTPVTVLDNRVCVGKSISTVRTGLITDIALMEYCNKQVLTFDWPHGAASVMVYIAPKGHDPRQGLTGRCYEIALADYEKYGGMRFAGDLPNVGCSLHLVPMAFTGGRRVLGVPASIEYGGLLRLWYDVRILRDHSGFPVNAAVTIRAETQTNGSPPFVLVNNPERIPLTVHDGDPVNMSATDGRGKPTSLQSKEFQCSALGAEGTGNEVWVGDVGGLRGWIRLFANLPAKRLRILALLDPPVESLVLAPPKAIAR